MSEQSDIPEILADRLNSEPVILRGLSNTELMLVIKFAVLVWIPLCLLVAFLFGNFAMGLGVAMVLVLLTVLFAGTVLQKVKRGRPRNYYQHKMKFFLNSLFAKKAYDRKDDIIKKDGHWSLGRSGKWD